MEGGSSSLDKTSICLKELAAAAVSKVQAQMMKEHNLSTPPAIDAITFFLVTSLSPDDASTHVQGKLVAFLEQILPGKPVAIGPLYRCLTSEIERRNNRVADATTFEELIKQKALTRADILAELGRLPARVDVDGLLTAAWIRLTQEGMGYEDLERLKEAVKRFELERTNKANTVLMAASAAVSLALKASRASGGYETLTGKLHQVVANIRATGTVDPAMFTNGYLQGIALYNEVCNE